MTRSSSNDAYASNTAYTVTRSYTVNGLNPYTAAGPAAFQYDANADLTNDGSTASASSRNTTPPGAVCLFVALGLLAAARPPSATDVDYGFAASVEGGRLTVQHRILNRSGRSLCFFPDSIDIDKARLRGAGARELPNIYNSGFVAGRQVAYFAAPDGRAHLFSYSADLREVFRPAVAADKLETLEFDFYGFDCNALTEGREGVKPLVHKTASAAVDRRPPR